MNAKEQIMTDIVIVSAKRTPIGSFQGQFSPVNGVGEWHDRQLRDSRSNRGAKVGAGQY